MEYLLLTVLVVSVTAMAVRIVQSFRPCPYCGSRDVAMEAELGLYCNDCCRKF